MENARATLPDGVGGTIAGGPMRPLDLMEILNRHQVLTPGQGAVSGAAHVVAAHVAAARLMESGDATEPDTDEAIALSDGSRICFASLRGRVR